MRIRAGTAALALVLAAGCETGLNLNNPNAPTQETALSSIDGIVATELGMQDQFAASVLSYVRAPALVTDEWGTASKALAADQSLFSGDAIDASYGVVADPYYNTYRIARTADVIIGAVPKLGGLSAGFAAGLTANAKLFKAMALGMAAQQYERLPIDASPAGGTPVPRAQVFTEVIRLLESARADVANVTDAELSGFTTRALSPGVDLRNTIDAMLARYYLITGQYQQAFDAAGRVNLAKTSLLSYPGTEINPIYNYSVVAGYVAPLRSWARAAKPGDKRVPFWVDTLATPPNGNPPTLQLVPFNMFGHRNDPFPLYVPGEMRLIRAEALMRLPDAAANLQAAIDLINAEREEVPTATTPGAGFAKADSLTTADLPNPDAVLTRIAYERRFELFSQGLRWEDIRRFAGLAGGVAKASFLPMPQAECTTNPNAGC
ncbi:MAG TPA: RagB/SusD family nutrient uptake outer membrane protein [Gemmatimonadaceae bacterium]|nr:RagB/SusD family nutrient uptake outer membrane protein [Gemmatimonadaceae bacterium]